MLVEICSHSFLEQEALKEAGPDGGETDLAIKHAPLKSQQVWPTKGMPVKDMLKEYIMSSCAQKVSTISVQDFSSEMQKQSCGNLLQGAGRPT